MQWLHVRQNHFEIISVFYFTCNHAWNWNKIISAAEGVPKLFQNYFGDNKYAEKHPRAATRQRNNFEIISGKFSRVEIKLFQTDVDKGRNNFEKIILFYMYQRHKYHAAIMTLELQNCNWGWVGGFRRRTSGRRDLVSRTPMATELWLVNTFQNASYVCTCAVKSPEFCARGHETMH